MLVIKQLPVAIDFHSIFFHMATVNCLFPNILQNIFFCVQQKEETPSGLE